MLLDLPPDPVRRLARHLPTRKCGSSARVSRTYTGSQPCAIKPPRESWTMAHPSTSTPRNGNFWSAGPAKAPTRMARRSRQLNPRNVSRMINLKRESGLRLPLEPPDHRRRHQRDKCVHVRAVFDCMYSFLLGRKSCWGLCSVQRH